jgi:predicted O-methyltransferase YrrM
MGIQSLLRFANFTDLKDGIKNPQKGIRVIKQSVVGGQTTSITDPSEYTERQIKNISELVDADGEKVEDLLENARTGRINRRIENCETQIEDKPFSLGGMMLGGETAYLLTRLLEPDTILEIGVANGISTLYILEALNKLETTADVRAIDKPQFESHIRKKRGARGLSGVGGIIPDEKETGWVASINHRSRHGYQYYVGDFTQVLPKIVDSMPPVDLAIYDASKDSDEMQMAYEILIQSLSSQGVLVSDDIEVNDTFSQVTEQNDGKAVEFGGIGVFKNEL